MVKDITHDKGWINLKPGSCSQFMEPQEVQKYSYTLGMRQMIQQTNFVYISLFYRLFQYQEQSRQKRIRICQQVHHKFQRWYMGRVPRNKIQTWCKSKP